MFVCLSSGHRPRYLRDIARSLALPRGTWLAFRYDRRWVAPDLQERLDAPKRRKKLSGADVLIAYIDQSDESREIEVVPCRHATLVDVVSVGQTASLQLELGKLAHAAEIATFNEELRERAALLPRRTAGGVDGAYWFETDALSPIELSESESAWEAIVAQLAPRSDFSHERFFYKVQGIVDVGRGKSVRAKKNTFRLRPGRDYELRLYHFYPGEENVDAEVQASATGAPIEFTTTPELLLDSRYDLKRIPFRTGSPVPSARGVLTLRRRSREVESKDWEWDLDLGLRVRAAVFRQLLFALLVAGLLAATPILAAYSNSNLSSSDQRIIAIVAGLSSLLVGITAAFGLRRSI